MNFYCLNHFVALGYGSLANEHICLPRVSMSNISSNSAPVISYFTAMSHTRPSLLSKPVNSWIRVSALLCTEEEVEHPVCLTHMGW